MFNKKTIRDIDLDGKTVLLRADYNVPIENAKIMDDYRIQQSLPTIQFLLNNNVKLIICAHLGRPTGPDDHSNSLFPVAKRLQQLLDIPVEFATDCIGPAANKAATGLKPGTILLLENLRFHIEEEANDQKFAEELASLADIFVQDGFGVVHRAHASTEAVTHFLPSVAGLLLEKEVSTISQVMENPARPLMAIVGGAKIADKIDLLNRFIDIADFVAVGGAMANTFLKSEGFDIGDSLYDNDHLSLAKQIMARAASESKKRNFVFSVPHDVVVAKKIDKTSNTRTVELRTHVLADIENYPNQPPSSASQISQEEMILDIGPFDAAFIAGGVQLSKTVVWNGTLGVTETAGIQGPIGPFSHGTQTVAEAIIGDMGAKPFSLVGGGDTVSYIESRKLVDRFDHVSTGGGASLELMSGSKLPGVEALMDK
ncbi:MAG: phosphoglycerate kinase [Candidatus Saccharimonadales bacterium]